MKGIVKYMVSEWEAGRPMVPAELLLKASGTDLSRLADAFNTKKRASKGKKATKGSSRHKAWGGLVTQVRENGKRVNGLYRLAIPAPEKRDAERDAEA